MKFYLLSDNTDTLIGMRLAGIEGEIVHDAQVMKNRLNELMQKKELGLILMTENVIKLDSEYVQSMKLTCKQPLIVEVGDRHGAEHFSESLAGYVSEAVGIKI